MGRGRDAMRKRPSIYLFLVIGCALFGTIGWYYFIMTPSPSAKINRASYGRIQEGMRLEQIEAVIGLSPGDYRDDGRKARSVSPMADMRYVDELYSIGSDGWEETVDWAGNEYGIILYFDSQGVLYNKALLIPMKKRGPKTPLDLLKDWLGL
jgi:hypothetical protein